MGVLQYSSVKPALAEPVLTAVSPYMFWLMFRNVNALTSHWNGQYYQSMLPVPADYRAHCP